MNTGSYILILELKKSTSIDIGKKGRFSFQKGFYCYVGSAMGGLEKRIKRHLKKEKKLHWHIDFLSQYAEIIKVIRFLSYTKDECKLSKRMESFADKIPIPGFGSSDCKCISHLYFFAENPMNCFPQTDCFFSSSPDK